MLIKRKEYLENQKEFEKLKILISVINPIASPYLTKNDTKNTNIITSESIDLEKDLEEIKKELSEVYGYK